MKAALGVRLTFDLAAFLGAAFLTGAAGFLTAGFFSVAFFAAGFFVAAILSSPLLLSLFKYFRKDPFRYDITKSAFRGYVISVLSVVPPSHKQAFAAKLSLSQDNQMALS
jgi:hypothetical protein